MEKSWYIFLTDHHRGPYSTREIRSLFRRGQLDPLTPLWKEDFSQWHLLKDLPEFQVTMSTIDSLDEPIVQSPVNVAFPKPTELTVETESIEALPKKLNPLGVYCQKFAHFRVKLCLFIFSLTALSFYLHQAMFLPDTSEHNNNKTSSQLPEKGLEVLGERNYKMLKETSLMSPGGKLRIALAIAKDNSTIWMSSNRKGPMDIEMKLTGIRGKILSTESVVFYSSGKLKDNWAYFQQFKFEEGKEIAPGLYRLEMKWVSGKMIKTVFLANFPEQEYRKMLKTFHMEQKWKKLGTINEMRERFQTTLAIIDQVEQLFVNVVQSIKVGADIKEFVQQYSRSLAPLLGEIVLDTHLERGSSSEKVEGFQLREEINFHKEQGKKLGIGIMEMVEKIRIAKNINLEARKKFIQEFQNKLVPIRNHYLHKLDYLSKFK